MLHLRPRRIRSEASQPWMYRFPLFWVHPELRSLQRAGTRVRLTGSSPRRPGTTPHVIAATHQTTERRKAMSTLDSPAPVTTYGTPATGVRNGVGTAALVLGILAIVLSWTVLGGIVLGVLAVIFGIVGRGRANRGEATNRGSATAGIVTGVIGVVLAGALIA